MTEYQDLSSRKRKYTKVSTFFLQAILNKAFCEVFLKLNDVHESKIDRSGVGQYGN